MRVLWPDPGDVEPAELYRVPAAGRGRPWVRVNMITSVDGATNIGGTSGRLGGAADRELFLVLRSLADTILVGAGTVRAERYGPVRLPEPLQAARVRAGKPPLPDLAVVTRTGSLDWSTPLFTQPTTRPLVVTGRAGAARVPDGAGVDVVVAGEDDVDLAEAVDRLGERGATSVLAEGGPTINGYLATAGLLDDLCLTLSPVVVGGASSRVVAGPEPDLPVPVRLAHLAEVGGLLFLRFERAD